MKAVYHLKLSKSDIKGAKVALLPGDPGRVPKIAEALCTGLGGAKKANAQELAYKREFCTWLVKSGAARVLVTSTGIGGPSTSIAVEELAMLGVRTFIRVGTTGAIQRRIRPGDVVISTAAVRLDGASSQYAPIEYPAVADLDVTNALIAGAKAEKIRYHAGITCSTDTFYPGQERKDSFRGYVPRRFQGITKEWEKLNVLNYEMEAATLFTMCGALGLKGGCVTGVVLERHTTEKVMHDDLRRAETHAIKVAASAVRILLS